MKTISKKIQSLALSAIVIGASSLALAGGGPHERSCTPGPVKRGETREITEARVETIQFLTEQKLARTFSVNETYLGYDEQNGNCSVHMIKLNESRYTAEVKLVSSENYQLVSKLTIPVSESSLIIGEANLIVGANVNSGSTQLSLACKRGVNPENGGPANFANVKGTLDGERINFTDAKCRVALEGYL